MKSSIPSPFVQDHKRHHAAIAMLLPGVMRLVSMTQDADKLGELVWAKDPTKEVGVWWPAEMIDPWAPPPGFVITPAQVG